MIRQWLRTNLTELHIQSRPLWHVANGGRIDLNAGLALGSILANVKYLSSLQTLELTGRRKQLSAITFPSCMSALVNLQQVIVDGRCPALHLNQPWQVTFSRHLSRLSWLTRLDCLSAAPVFHPLHHLVSLKIHADAYCVLDERHLCVTRLQHLSLNGRGLLWNAQFVSSLTSLVHFQATNVTVNTEEEAVMFLWPLMQPCLRLTPLELGHSQNVCLEAYPPVLMLSDLWRLTALVNIAFTGVATAGWEKLPCLTMLQDITISQGLLRDGMPLPLCKSDTTGLRW